MTKFAKHFDMLWIKLLIWNALTTKLNAQIVFRDFDLKVCTYMIWILTVMPLLMAALLIGAALDSNKSRTPISRKISWNWFHEKTIIMKLHIINCRSYYNAIAFLLFISITGSIISYLYQMSLSSRHLLLIISLLTSAFRCKL